MTTAEKIVAAITAYKPSAVTLAMGYMVGPLNSGREHFPEVCHVVEEKRNASGRCTKLVAEYKDKSRIIFTWSESRGARYGVVQQ